VAAPGGVEKHAHRKLGWSPSVASPLRRPRHQVLFNASTEHIIMIPSSARKYLGLASKRWACGTATRTPKPAAGGSPQNSSDTPRGTA
jgi:hypothetical protein